MLFRRSGPKNHNEQILILDHIDTILKFDTWNLKVRKRKRNFGCRALDEHRRGSYKKTSEDPICELAV